MRLKRYGIAVAGSHGKTSTMSMVAAVLTEAGLDPAVVVGGKVQSLGGSNARLGSGEFLVAEADESDGSFLKLSPLSLMPSSVIKAMAVPAPSPPPVPLIASENDISAPPTADIRVYASALISAILRLPVVS